MSYCKGCKFEYDKQYRLCNKTKIVERQKRWGEANPGKNEARFKAWWNSLSPNDRYKKHKKSHLKALFGITLEQYDQMRISQNNQCAICNITFSNGNGQQACLDHDHNTGKVRQFLCLNHNSMLGDANDDPEIFQRAIEYINRWQRTESNIYPIESGEQWYDIDSKLYAKRWSLRNKYGITFKQLEEMYVSQQCRCAICDGEFKDRKDMHVDHDHQTGQVRGLLCSKHNWMLGRAKDNTKILRSAIVYLNKWKEIYEN